MTNFNVEKKLILFVDDDEESHDLMTLILTGYRLVTARDFTEGLRLARQRYFDLYIFDNWLPGRTGIELCRHIREFDPHTPIIFYSAVGYASDIQEALGAGAQAYLVKPVRLNELKRVVEQLIAVAGETAVEARLAELAAIHEELAIRRMEYTELRKGAKEKRVRARENRLRLTASQAFFAAGGSRGDFARLWPSMYLKEVRDRHNDGEPAATSGC